jgi:hypothetical protein
MKARGFSPEALLASIKLPEADLAQVSREQGALKKDPGGGRSASYSLLIE